MALTIELDDAMLQKLSAAADRVTKSVPEWARERLAEAAEEQLKAKSLDLEHLKRHFGSIEDPTFEAPARGEASREVDAFD